MFNMLTPHHIYCFYPSLLSRRVNVATLNSTPAQSSMLTSFNFSLTTFDTKQAFTDFPGVCREGCYSKTRSMFNLEGVLVNRWGGITGAYDDGSGANGVSVRATAVGRDVERNAERNAVLAGDPKWIRLLCNTILITDIPSRGSKEERIRIHLLAWANIRNNGYKR